MLLQEQISPTNLSIETGISQSTLATCKSIDNCGTQVILKEINHLKVNLWLL